MGKCFICGRPLSNPASIAAGVGPICGSRNYRGRIYSRFGSGLGGWSSIEEWEVVNHPCYSCKFFEVPGKDEEQSNSGPPWRMVTMHGQQKVFDKFSIGGYCKFLKALVDGNTIKEETECKGRHYTARKDKDEQPAAGLLKLSDGQIELFEFNQEEA